MTLRRFVPSCNEHLRAKYSKILHQKTENMISLEIATKSDLALVLPSLLIAGYLEQTGILPPTIKIFQDQNSLPGDSFVHLSLPSGEILQDEAIVQYFANTASTKDISSVWVLSREIEVVLPLTLEYRSKNRSTEAKAFSSKISSP